MLLRGFSEKLKKWIFFNFKKFLKKKDLNFQCDFCFFFNFFVIFCHFLSFFFVIFWVFFFFEKYFLFFWKVFFIFLKSIFYFFWKVFLFFLKSIFFFFLCYTKNYGIFFAYGILHLFRVKFGPIVKTRQFGLFFFIFWPLVEREKSRDS